MTIGPVPRRTDAPLLVWQVKGTVDAVFKAIQELPPPRSPGARSEPIPDRRSVTRFRDCKEEFMSFESRRREHVGFRYLWWCCDVEPGLAPDQKAEGNEAFAASFESLPADREPYEGWGETMADLCRRIARRHRSQL